MDEVAEIDELKAAIADLVNALELVLYMPDYDGTRLTSSQRLRIKNRAKRLIKEHKRS